MKISINQPSYLPWLGYFDRIAISDIHVVLDHVQFEKNSFVNRNKIKVKNNSIFLTVPVMTKGNFESLHINKLKINENVNWRRKHINSIDQNYKKSESHKCYRDELFNILNNNKEKLINIIKPLNEYFLKIFNIKTKIIYSSDLNLKNKKSDLILEICKKLGATTYLSGPFGKNYLNEEHFTNDNIKLLFHEYQSPVYYQDKGKFISNLSVIDYIFNNNDMNLFVQ